MAHRYGTSLSPQELVNKLNEGGWIISGGHLVRETGFPKFSIIKASLHGETLKIETSERSFEVPNDNIILINRWTAEIRHTFMRNQQRKKIEGGGWHEVPAIGVALRVSNPTLEENARKARDEEVRREEEEKARRAAEEFAARREQFITSINAGFAGKKLVKIEVVKECELRLLFEDNSMIEIDSDLGDCCGYNCGSAVVNGVSLHSYHRP